jgi:lipid-binding SYLF domain-containing protein
MKRFIATVALFALVLTAQAVDKLEIEQKARRLIDKFEAMQQKPDKRIPAEVLRKAQGIILLDRTKAGFLFAYQGGSGIAMVKDKKSGKWGPLAFLQANEGSLGFQIGGQQTFLVIILLTPETAAKLGEPVFEAGGEARGTAGNSSSGTEASVLSTEHPVMIYDDRQGLFGGASIKGGAISPNDEANRIYYGQPLLPKDILFDKKIKPTDLATTLARKIAEQAKK